MILHAALAAALLVLSASEPPQEKPAEKEQKPAPSVSCPPLQESGPCPVDPTDLLRNGLTFDPRAPQGVRPIEPEKPKPAPVDPGTVTLSVNVPTTKKEEGDD